MFYMYVTPGKVVGDYNAVIVIIGFSVSNMYRRQVIELLAAPTFVSILHVHVTHLILLNFI
jgi:hypothetical protein